MKCSSCGDDHDLLEPTFLRPGAVVTLTDEERSERVKESDDLCAIWGRSDAEPHRYFVRCVLKVRLLDVDEESAWGLWAEVDEGAFQYIVQNWTAPHQTESAPIKAVVANRVPRCPDTTGLPAMIRLTGPTTRPILSFDPASEHPFVVECTRGVCIHRVVEWLSELQ